MTITGYMLGRFTVPASQTLIATNNGGGPTTVNITAGNYFLEQFCTHLQAVLNAQRPGSGGATWTVSISLITGRITISMSAGTFTITWPSTNVRDLLGYTGSLTGVTSSTSTDAARGIFVPDAVFAIDGDPRTAPRTTDHRAQRTPQGVVYGMVGNSYRRHRNARWAHVERSRTWNTDTTIPNWERFIEDVQLGQGHSWFTPSSRVVLVDHTGALLGSEVADMSWQMVGIDNVETIAAREGWTGAWRIQIPELVSDGTY